MRTYLDCFPCFLIQALGSSAIAGADEKTQKKIMLEVADKLKTIDTNLCPTEFGRFIYATTIKRTGNPDPYLAAKNASNRLALKLYPTIKKKLPGSRDRLLTAIKLAIAGNIIDYGIKGKIDVTKELSKVLNEENNIIKSENSKVFDYAGFKDKLKKANKILYLGDNAGEIVFDRIFVEEIKRLYPKKEITFAVRASPIINDALMSDALSCGLDNSCRVISSGVDAPGTILRLCSKEFMKEFNSSDLIISKGQGNFEALSREKGPIYFLFMAKCMTVAQHLNCALMDILLLKNKRYNR